MMLEEMGAKAKAASLEMARATTMQKNQALKNIVAAIKKESDVILSANHEDIEAGKEAGLNEAMIDRLSLQGRLEGICDDIYNVTTLPDPVGQIFEKQTLPNGLKLSKMRTPLGVLGIIYEARPNVTLDVASLTIKTGNCAILRGGSETLRSNQSLVKVIQKALIETDLPPEAIQLIEDNDRTHVLSLLHLHQYVSLIIPRGGAGLHQFCRENSTIPVITGGIGICHLFVDETADMEKSVEVIYNAKTQRPTVCNALDTVLLHENIAERILPTLLERLFKGNVEFRVDEKTYYLIDELAKSKSYKVSLAGPSDWDIEWLSLILGIKIVKNIQEAMDHIQQHSTGHSDGILTINQQHAQQFVATIDSAVVYVNASTRFTDGAQFGLGAEVAISTQKLHARGPMGLQELTSYKWVVHGNYQVRE